MFIFPNFFISFRLPTHSLSPSIYKCFNPYQRRCRVLAIYFLCTTVSHMDKYACHFQFQTNFNMPYTWYTMSKAPAGMKKCNSVQKKKTGISFVCTMTIKMKIDKNRLWRLYCSRKVRKKSRNWNQPIRNNF